MNYPSSLIDCFLLCLLLPTSLFFLGWWCHWMEKQIGKLEMCPCEGTQKISPNVSPPKEKECHRPPRHTGCRPHATRAVSEKLFIVAVSIRSPQKSHCVKRFNSPMSLNQSDPEPKQTDALSIHNTAIVPASVQHDVQVCSSSNLSI